MFGRFGRPEELLSQVDVVAGSPGGAAGEQHRVEPGCAERKVTRTPLHDCHSHASHVDDPVHLLVPVPGVGRSQEQYGVVVSALSPGTRFSATGRDHESNLSTSDLVVRRQFLDRFVVQVRLESATQSGVGGTRVDPLLLDEDAAVSQSDDTGFQ